MSCGYCGHSAEDHGDAVVHSACCAEGCKCEEYDNPRYVVTARYLFDDKAKADALIQALDTHSWGESATEVTEEEV